MHNSIWTCQQKEPHPTLKPIDLPGDERSWNSPVPADWAPEEPTVLWPGSSTTSRAHGWPQALWSLLLCFWPCVSSRCWERMSHPHVGSGSSRQVQLNPVLCFLLSPVLLAQSWPGPPWFPVNTWSPQKSWWNSGSFWKTLDPPERSTQFTHHQRPLVPKKQCSTARAHRRTPTSRVRSPTGKALVKSPCCYWATPPAWTYRSRQNPRGWLQRHSPLPSPATRECKVTPFPSLKCSQCFPEALCCPQAEEATSYIRLVRRSPHKPCNHCDHGKVSCLQLAGLPLHPNHLKSKMVTWKANGSKKLKKKHPTARRNEVPD